MEWDLVEEEQDCLSVVALDRALAEELVEELALASCQLMVAASD